MLSILQSARYSLIQVPGNHELYTLPNDTSEIKGEVKYRACVTIANEYGVITPEVCPMYVRELLLTDPGRIHPLRRRGWPMYDLSDLHSL